MTRETLIDSRLESIEVDLGKHKDTTVVIRLFQRTLLPSEFKLPGNAYWQSIEVK